MINSVKKTIHNFFVAGINHRKTDAIIRSLYALNKENYDHLLTRARVEGLDEIFVISTCNRTEIYGFSSSGIELIDLLCQFTTGDSNLFLEIAYIKSGIEAVSHLFSVGAGLDSQILGDYEVIGQIKAAAKFAKERGFLGSFSERLINSAIQVSKLVKNQTELSTGTVSVAFSAVQWLRSFVQEVSSKNILLIGAGKIGRNTCKNLIEYLSPTQITLVNRTDETAYSFAKELNLQFAPFSELDNRIAAADIILVATNAPYPTILPASIPKGVPKVLIDLSIPQNVHSDFRFRPEIRYIDVDGLSRLKDETLQKRMAEVPKAELIIRNYVHEFEEWNQMHQHAATLQAVKTKLQEIHSKEIYNQKKGPNFHLEDIEQVSSRIIQRVINLMATKVRNNHQNDTKYIEVINDLFETGIK